MTSYERKILTALAEQGELYGVPLYEAVGGGTLVNVYVACDRLWCRDLVSFRDVDPTPERGDRSKRYFSITDTGHTVLKESD